MEMLKEEFKDKFCESNPLLTELTLWCLSYDYESRPDFLQLKQKIKETEESDQPFVSQFFKVGERGGLDSGQCGLKCVIYQEVWYRQTHRIHVHKKGLGAFRKIIQEPEPEPQPEMEPEPETEPEPEPKPETEPEPEPKPEEESQNKSKSRAKAKVKF